MERIEELKVKFDYFKEVIKGLQEYKVILSKREDDESLKLWKKVYESRQALIRMSIEIKHQIEDYGPQNNAKVEEEIPIADQGSLDAKAGDTFQDEEECGCDMENRTWCKKHHDEMYDSTQDKKEQREAISQDPDYDTCFKHNIYCPGGTCHKCQEPDKEVTGIVDNLNDERVATFTVCHLSGKKGYVEEDDCHCFCCGKHRGCGVNSSTVGLQPKDDGAEPSSSIEPRCKCGMPIYGECKACGCKEQDNSELIYTCGHKRSIVILDDSELSMMGYFQWKESVGYDGDKSQCWDCYCKHPGDCKGCPDCPGKWTCKCGLSFDELNTKHKCQEPDKREPKLKILGAKVLNENTSETFKEILEKGVDAIPDLSEQLDNSVCSHCGFKKEGLECDCDKK